MRDDFVAAEGAGVRPADPGREKQEGEGREGGEEPGREAGRADGVRHRTSAYFLRTLTPPKNDRRASGITTLPSACW